MLIIFSAIILIPILTFNTQEDAVSVIDNRKLAQNPFSRDALTEGNTDLTSGIESYVSDRIGLRDKMILAYTLLNDKLFGKMIHPTYSYGKDGYVFGAGVEHITYDEYHEAFADMVKELQLYCEERSVPFLFVFNPSKPSVLTEYLPDGVNYDNSWTQQLFNALDERGVNYIDNTEYLSQKNSEGEVVFNKKYDANHWNDLGAFYGVNNILDTLGEDFPQIELNKLSDFNITQQIQTTLPVSEFPINEAIPVFKLTSSIENLTEKYTDELYRHPNYTGFGYFINAEKAAAGVPKTLVFQGSYMNGKGYKFLANGLGEYIYVHDYQNVIELPYYFNAFQPECVVFEVAEYTLKNKYFDLRAMRNIDLTPSFETASDGKENVDAGETIVTINKGEALTTISWSCEGQSPEHVWLIIGSSLDMCSDDSGFTVTVETPVYEKYRECLQIAVSDGNKILVYNAAA